MKKIRFVRFLLQNTYINTKKWEFLAVEHSEFSSEQCTNAGPQSSTL